MSVPLLSVAEAATALRVSPRTVRRMVDAGELPSLKVRHQVRFLASDVDRYVAAQRKAASR